MITNFDYLKKDSKFSRFADVAISAEKIILMDPEASILNSRRAMEFAIKWMYSVDSELEMPYQDNLQSLMNAEEYRQIVGPDLWKRMDYIRRQIYFVNQIVEYIVHNGMMKDLSVLQESPFTDRGSVVEIFTDLSVWMGIRKVIDMINANAVA